MKNKLKYILIALITLFMIITISTKTGLLNKVSFALEDNQNIGEEGNTTNEDNNDEINNNDTTQNNTEENNIENNDTNETNNANNIDNNIQNSEENNTNDINNEPTRDGENTNNSSSVEIRKLEAKIVEVTSVSGATSVVGEDGYHVITPLVNKTTYPRYDQITVKTKIEYAISGEGPYEPGSVKINVPKAENIVPGSSEIIMSVPNTPTCGSNSDYNYYFDSATNEYIIQNCKTLPGGAEATFEIQYHQSGKTSHILVNEYNDMEANGPFYAKMSVDYNGENVTSNTNNDYYKVNKTTGVNKILKEYGSSISSSDNTYPYSTYHLNNKIYYKWLDSWGEKPADADDYYYLIWGFGVLMQDNVTQAYDLKFTDNVSIGDPVFININSDAFSEYGNSHEHLILSHNQVTESFSYIKNNMRGNGNHVIYGKIITRIKVEDIPSNGKVDITNTLKVECIPKDGVDEHTFAETTAVGNVTVRDATIVVPTGYSGYSKKSIANTSNNVLYGSYEKKAPVINSTFAWEHSVTTAQNRDTRDFTTGEYFKIPIKTVLLDENIYFYKTKDVPKIKYTSSTYHESLDERDVEIKNLIPEEYYNFTGISLSKFTYKRYFLDEFTRATSSSNDPNTIDKIYIFGKWENEWKEIGYFYYNEDNISFVFSNEELGSVDINDNSTVNLTSQCKGIKAEVNSPLPITFTINTFVKFNQDNLNNLFLNKDYGSIQNIGETALYKNDMRISNEMKYSRVNFKSYAVIQKSEATKVLNTTNNSGEKSVELNYKLSVDEYFRSDFPGGKTLEELIEENKEYIQSEGCIYDLLPKGTILKKINSITTITPSAKEDKILSSEHYTYKLISNFNDSGRDLLIIYISNLNNNLSADIYYDYSGQNYISGYIVDYTLFYPWDSISDYGNVVYNDFIYESGTSLYEGKKNDGSDDLEIENQEIYKNIGTRSSEPVYLTGSVTTTLNYPTSAELGLYKRVKGTYDSQYSNEGHTNIGETYSYKLHFGSSTNTDTSNMILFDSLENYNESGVTDNRWRGTFDDIDISQPKMKGINPIVYYSEIENLDLEENNDISIGAVWKRYTNLTDKTKVKAIAVDMRKGTDGSNYTLEEGETINVTIYMKAPTDNDVIYPSIKNNAYAYNNVYLKNDLTPKGGTTTPMFIHQDYTKISINEPTMDYEFIKKDHVTGEPISNVKFTLSGTSFTGEAYNLEATSDSEGKVTFKNLKYNMNGYTITEEVPSGYAKEAESYKLKIDGKYENDEYSLFGTLYSGDTKLNENVIYNSPLTDIKLRKLSADVEESLSLFELIFGRRVKNLPKLVIDNDSYSDGRDYLNPSIMSDVTFTLEGKTLDNITVEKQYVTDSDGYITLDNISPGDYELIEGVSSYNVVPSTWTLKVNPDNTFDIYEKGKSNYNNTSYDEENEEVYLWNDKVYSLTLTEASELDEEFDFTIEISKLDKHITINDHSKIEVLKGTLKDEIITPDDEKIILSVKLKPNELVTLNGLTHTSKFKITQTTLGFITNYDIKDTEIFKEEESRETDKTDQGRRDITVTYVNTIKEEPKEEQPKEETPNEDNKDTKKEDKPVEKGPKTLLRVQNLRYVMAIFVILIPFVFVYRKLIINR